MKAASVSASSLIRVAALSGSLRKSSYNRGLIRSAIEISKTSINGLQIEYIDISPLPLLNTDLEGEGSFPPAIEAFRQKILEADSILFASPEYNYSFTGIIFYYYSLIYLFMINLQLDNACPYCLTFDDQSHKSVWKLDNYLINVVIMMDIATFVYFSVDDTPTRYSCVFYFVLMATTCVCRYQGRSEILKTCAKLKLESSYNLILKY